MLLGVKEIPMILNGTCLLGYLDTWSGFEAAKTAPWPVGDSTTLVNSLSPQMSELVEDAVVS